MHYSHSLRDGHHLWQHPHDSRWPYTVVTISSLNGTAVWSTMTTTFCMQTTDLRPPTGRQLHRSRHSDTSVSITSIITIMVGGWVRWQLSATTGQSHEKAFLFHCFFSLTFQCYMHEWVFCHTEHRARPLVIRPCVFCFAFSPLTFYTLGHNIILISIKIIIITISRIHTQFLLRLLYIWKTTNTHLNTDWKFFVIFTLAAECPQLYCEVSSIQCRHNWHHQICWQTSFELHKESC